MDPETELIFVNVAVFATLAVGILQWRRSLRSVEMEPGALFRLLGKELAAAYPDLPIGFTLKEGLMRAKTSRPDLDWEAIERALAGYEAQRFGEGPPAEAPPELQSLARSLWRARP